MSIQASMNGTRLAYVVIPLEPFLKSKTVKREKIVFEEKKWKNGKTTYPMKRVMQDEPAGFMVYFPRGHCLRIRDEEHLAHYGLDKPAEYINLDGMFAKDSPASKLLTEQDEKKRRGIFESLEQQVIKLATAKSGKVVLKEQADKQTSLAA